MSVTETIGMTVLYGDIALSLDWKKCRIGGIDCCEKDPSLVGSTIDCSAFPNRNATSRRKKKLLLTVRLPNKSQLNRQDNKLLPNESLITG